VIGDTFGSLFASRKKICVDGCSATRRFDLPCNDLACAEERSIATSCEPRWMLISCVGAIMLRTTTLENAAFFLPQ
jgi:hypothetical protein